MSVTVYSASKPRHAPMWRNLRDEIGLNIIATWIDFDGDDDVKDWEQLWLDCAGESAAADLTLVYLERGDELRGAYVEMGCALASGKLVFFVNPDGVHCTDAIHHPQVTEFKSLDAAIAVIKEMSSPPTENHCEKNSSCYTD